jgi:Flp pilus assembly protein TadD
MSTIVELLAQGMQKQQTGELSEAAQLYRQILEVDPDHAEALYRLAGICLASGSVQEAVLNYQKVLDHCPNEAMVHSDLGIAFAQLGQWEEATACFRHAVNLNPQYMEGYNNLGLALATQGRLDEAVTCYRQSLSLRPDNALVYNNLGNVLRDLERWDEALACYQQALNLKPDYAEAHNNEGIAYARQGKFDEAAVRFRQALWFRPDYAKAHSNLGNALRNLGQLDDALACYRQAVHLDPHYADAYRNRALVRLLQGDFEQGWQDYEWRWQCPDLPRPSFPRPRWDGGPLNGRTILLHAEQGLGDTLQFVRYAPLVKRLGGRVVVQCQPSLLSLLASCPGIDHLSAQGSALPDFDVHTPLLSLPGTFGTTLATIPAQVPYLRADTRLVERWRRELVSLSSAGREAKGAGIFRIGIAWQGSPRHPGDRQRSIPLRNFAALLHVPGIQWFSLQVGPGCEQLAGTGDRFPVIDLGRRFDPDSFQDAAAVVTALDLVISVDSAMAHLAGALGIPVWVLLPYAPDWRWLLERQDSPWYPTMRLFRQKEEGQWGPVFERVTADVAGQVARLSTVAVVASAG